MRERASELGRQIREKAGVGQTIELFSQYVEELNRYR
jgi:hypothetical protein